MFYFFDSLLSSNFFVIDNIVIVASLCLCVSSVTKSCPSLQPHGLQPTRLLCQWDFPGKNTKVDTRFLLWEIFLTPGIESTSPSLAGRFFNAESPGKNFYLDTGLFDPDCHVFCFLFISPSFSFYLREEFLTLSLNPLYNSVFLPFLIFVFNGF